MLEVSQVLQGSQALKVSHLHEALHNTTMYVLLLRIAAGLGVLNISEWKVQSLKQHRVAVVTGPLSSLKIGCSPCYCRLFSGM